MRGGHVSRPIEELMLEAKNLAKNGQKSYCWLHKTQLITGSISIRKETWQSYWRIFLMWTVIEWIRLHMHFGWLPHGCLGRHAQRSNICKYIDIPLQHGSSKCFNLCEEQHTRKNRATPCKPFVKRCGMPFEQHFIAGHRGTEKEFDEMTVLSSGGHVSID